MIISSRPSDASSLPSSHAAAHIFLSSAKNPYLPCFSISFEGCRDENSVMERLKVHSDLLVYMYHSRPVAVILGLLVWLGDIMDRLASCRILQRHRQIQLNRNGNKNRVLSIPTCILVLSSLFVLVVSEEVKRMCDKQAYPITSLDNMIDLFFVSMAREVPQKGLQSGRVVLPRRWKHVLIVLRINGGSFVKRCCEVSEEKGKGVFNLSNLSKRNLHVVSKVYTKDFDIERTRQR